MKKSANKMIISKVMQITNGHFLRTCESFSKICKYFICEDNKTKIWTSISIPILRAIIIASHIRLKDKDMMSENGLFLGLHGQYDCISY